MPFIRSILTTAFLFAVLGLQAQQHSLFSVNKLLINDLKETFLLDVDTLKVFTYFALSPDVEEYDTLMELGDEAFALRYSNVTIEAFDEENSSTKFSYGPTRKLTFTLTRTFSATGKLLKDKMDFGSFSSTRAVRYDETGRVIEVLQDGERSMGFTYRNDFLVDSLWMDLMGMGEGVAGASRRGDTLHYEMQISLGKMGKLFGGKAKPREYSQVLYDENLDRYQCFDYKEDQERGEMLLNKYTLFNGAGKELEEIRYTPSGEVERHLVYDYDNEGRPTSLTNALSSQVHEWIYDEAGRPLQEITYPDRKVYEYDERGNYTRCLIYSSGEKRLSTVILREFTYRQ